MQLISVHVPKCAGTSLRNALINAFGEQHIFFDNADRLLDPQAPINLDRPRFLREFLATRDALLAGKSVAHGHFCIDKYAGIHAPRATILRHPVERLISHYFFWKNLPTVGHSLHDQFLAEQPTLPQFARMPAFRYFYTQIMFPGVDMAIFDLVGTTENVRDTTARLEKLIARPLHLESHNQNQSERYQEQKSDILHSPALLSELKDLLATDIAFYERHTQTTR